MTWQERRKLAYAMHEFDDVCLEHEVVQLSGQALVNMIVKFFETESSLVYPAKAYFVAIVYAYCLNRYFGEDFYCALNNKELLPDDHYFVVYSEDKPVYDGVIARIDLSRLTQYPSTQKTLTYFKQEFLLGD